MAKAEKRVEIVPSGQYAWPGGWMTEFDKMFEDFDRLFWRPRLALDRMQVGEGLRIPRVNIQDKDDAVVVSAEMPGVTKKDLGINVHENVLELRAERKVEKEEKDEETGYVRKEMSSSSFYRQIPLGTDIVPEECDAELKDGILTVTLKKAQEKPKKHSIAVK